MSNLPKSVTKLLGVLKSISNGTYVSQDPTNKDTMGGNGKPNQGPKTDNGKGGRGLSFNFRNLNQIINNLGASKVKFDKPFRFLQ
jgi:hypothetical protein